MREFTEKERIEFEKYADKMISDERLAPKEYKRFKRLARLKGDKELIQRIIEQERNHEKWDTEIKKREI